MTSRRHSRAGRVLLSLALLLVTQLALAGQLCRFVMASAMNEGHPSYAASQLDVRAVDNAPSCCDEMPAPSLDCPSALVGATHPTDASFGNAQSGHSAPPLHVESTLPFIDWRTLAVTLPARPARPAFPIYLLFGRFLN